MVKVDRGASVTVSIDWLRNFGTVFDGISSVMMSLINVVLARVTAPHALPIGIWAARGNRADSAVRQMFDFMQTLPVFVYLIPAVSFFGVGVSVVPGVVATTVLAVPPAVRLTELGIRQVDKEVVEAALAFGASPAKCSGTSIPHGHAVDHGPASTS